MIPKKLWLGLYLGADYSRTKLWKIYTERSILSQAFWKFNWTYSSDTIIALFITLLLVISKIAGRWTSSCQKSGSSRRRRDGGQRNRCGWNGTQMSIHMRLVDDILRLGMYLTADVDILRAIFDSNWVWISYKLNQNFLIIMSPNSSFYITRVIVKQ